jgi:hypothetical protein
MLETAAIIACECVVLNDVSDAALRLELFRIEIDHGGPGRHCDDAIQFVTLDCRVASPRGKPKPFLTSQ